MRGLGSVRAFTHPGVFGSSLRWELRRSAASISGSPLVALMSALLLSVTGLSSSSTTGLPAVCQRESLAGRRERIVEAHSDCCQPHQMSLNWSSPCDVETSSS